VARLLEGNQLGVAHHQVDTFLFGADWTDYLGRLCTYGTCPKGKPECLVPGCGREPLLRQHEDFVLSPDALAASRAVPLYERGRGILCRAAELEVIVDQADREQPAIDRAMIR
jgi:hypothetical protein